VFRFQVNIIYANFMIITLHLLIVDILNGDNLII
jgi:hypothetical protein